VVKMTEEKIFVVEMFMSSPNKQKSSKRIDEYKREITHTFDEKTRREISRIRAYGTGIKNAHCLRFFSMYICKESRKEMIKSVILKADREFKRLHPDLSAGVEFIELSQNGIRESEIFGKIHHAIKTQVYGSLYERLTELTKKNDIPDKSYNALLKMVESLKSVNIFDDPEINAIIENTRENINSRTLAPVLSQITNEIQKLQNPYSFIEPEEEPGEEPREEVRSPTERKGTPLNGIIEPEITLDSATGEETGN